jgi:hypothetical protein
MVKAPQLKPTICSEKPTSNYKNCVRIFVLLTQYFSGDKIEKNEMGGACSTYGGEERHIQGFGGET